MKLAISLLNRNGLYDTIKCIDTLLQSDFLEYKIYLLDNGSTDPHEYTLLQKRYNQNKNIIINRSPINLWFTGGNNYNFQLMFHEWTFEFVLLLNNDCKVKKHFLWEFLDSIEKINKKWIFWPIIKWYDESIQAAWCHINLRTWSSTRLKEIQSWYYSVDYVTGSCMIVSIEVLQSTGMLDDRYFAYREEADLCLRAKDSGYNTYIVPIQGIYHKEETANKRVRPYYTYLMFRNRLLFLKKHGTYLQYIFSRLILCIYIIVIFPFTFWIKNYKYLWMALRDGTHNTFGRRII